MRKLLLGLFFGLLTQAALAQAPGSLPGCQYNATPPTLSDKQTTVWQCDSSGKLITSATATPPGGSNGQLQYNNAGAFGGITGATTNGTFVTLTTPVIGAATGTSLAVSGLLQAGTTIGISTDTFLSRLAAATWHLGAADVAAPVAQTLGVQGVVAGTANTAGANLTIAGSVSTGSAAGGSIIFQTAAAGGAGSGQNALATALTLLSNGQTQLLDGTAALPSFRTTSENIGLYRVSAGNLGMAVSNALVLSFNSSQIWLRSDSSEFIGGAAADLRLVRDAANTFALRNSTTAQKFSAYNTFTDASNYERGVFDWAGTANVLTIGTEKAGTGSARNLQFIVAGVNKLDYGISTAGQWSFATGLSAAGVTLSSSGVDVTNSRKFTFSGTGGGAIGSSADGVFSWTNAGGTDFTRLQFGGTTSSFPAIARNGIKLEAKLADDSTYASFAARGLIVAGAVPTLTLAGGTCAGTVIAGGSTAGTVTLTGVCAATNTMALTVMPTAPTGYACDALDRTLGTSLLTETATTATTVTFTFGGTTGATDVLAYKCLAY